MNKVLKIFLPTSLVFFIIVLFYAVIQLDDKMDKYNIFIYQDRHRYRTDKVETTPDGIRFVDHEGKNVYICGKYIIEELKD